MRRKAVSRKRVRDESSSGEKSPESPTESSGKHEDETETSDVPMATRRGAKKVASVKSNQSTLDKFKVLETKSKKSDKQNKDILSRDCQVMVERCEDPQEKDVEESGETSKSSVENGEDKKAKNVKKVAKRGSKRKAEVEEEDEDDDVKPSKSVKTEKQSDTSRKASKKEQIPDVSLIDFSNESKSPDGKPWNFKITSWNINGIRAWLEKNGHSYLAEEKPDILCVQETKCSDDKLPEEMKKVEDYHAYWLSGDKDGYSGVGILSKKEPVSVKYGIDISEHDTEGRVITAEYEQFYLVAAYVPNAGRGLVRLEYRMKWDEDFRAYLKKLDSLKPVILCGDLNVAHEEIDLANPKTNKKNAGFTKEEREGFTTLLGEGFVDSFRRLYPDVTGAYTFWTYMMNARAKNVGWRLDYFVLSEKLCDKLCDNVIRKDVFGSDHCPITLFLSL